MANSSTSTVRYKKRDGIQIDAFLSESQVPILFQRQTIFLAEMAFKSGNSEKVRSLPPTIDPDLVDFKNNIESLDDSYVYRICHEQFEELFPAESNNQDLKKKFQDIIFMRNDVAHQSSCPGACERKSVCTTSSQARSSILPTLFAWSHVTQTPPFQVINLMSILFRNGSVS